jgi:hypothetical protein
MHCNADPQGVVCRATEQPLRPPSSSRLIINPIRSMPPPALITCALASQQNARFVLFLDEFLELITKLRNFSGEESEKNALQHLKHFASTSDNSFLDLELEIIEWNN